MGCTKKIPEYFDQMAEKLKLFLVKRKDKCLVFNQFAALRNPLKARMNEDLEKFNKVLLEYLV